VTFWDKLNPPPRVRRWAYGVAGGTVAVLTIYGVVSVDEAAAWGLLAAALFGVAAGNTDVTKDG
jgi:hypothetical protein